MRLSENELVTLHVERQIQEIKGRINDTCYVRYKSGYNVVDVTRPSPNEIAPMERPYLNADEFLYRMNWYWKNAAECHLDFTLALQLLSCQEGSYGRGGIGTQPLAGVATTAKPINDLKTTVSRLLPAEFLRPRDKLQYGLYTLAALLINPPVKDYMIYEVGSTAQKVYRRAHKTVILLS